MSVRSHTISHVNRPVRFTVVGRPQQKGSKTSRMYPRPGGGVNVRVVDSNDKAKPWAASVSAAAAEAYNLPELITEPVLVELVFYFQRPKGHWGTGRNAGELRSSAPEHMASMPDVDKLARCTLDALTGVVLRDDAQVVQLYAVKAYGTPERAEIVVVRL
jgi:Holliday junction resolvase RusA-like endonuclease